MSDGRGTPREDPGRFWIGELARAAGVTPQTIRYYERAGVLERPLRTPSGYRLYGREALERLQFIRVAQSLGFSLAEIRELVALSRAGRAPCARVRALLRGKLQRLDRRIAELRAFRRELAAAVRALEALPDQADSSPAVCSLIVTLGRLRSSPNQRAGPSRDLSDRVGCPAENSRKED